MSDNIIKEVHAIRKNASDTLDIIYDFFNSGNQYYPFKDIKERLLCIEKSAIYLETILKDNTK